MLSIPEQYTSLTPLGPISWEEAFDIWRELEARQDSWKQHWTERGFNSWDEWRTAYVTPFHPETLSWGLFRIADPIRDLPSFYGTPTKAWIEKAYEGETTRQLKDIAQLPVITENKKILDIKRGFPENTLLIGIIHDGKIVLIEGMHRASALATWGSETPFLGKISIALAEWNNSIPAIGGNYKTKYIPDSPRSNDELPIEYSP